MKHDVIPVELSQEVAARIANARFQLLPPALAMMMDLGVTELRSTSSGRRAR